MATSQKVVLPVVALLSLNSLASGIFSPQDALLVKFAAVFLPTLVAWVFFTGAGLLIQKTLPNVTVARIVAISALYGLTELARLMTIFAVVGDRASGAEFGLAFRVSGALTTGLLLFAALATVLNDARDYRVSYQRLVTHLEASKTAAQEAQATTVKTRLQIVEHVRRTLDFALAHALSLSTAQQSTPSAVSDELFRISQDVVRPLSTELVSEQTNPVVLNQQAPPMRVPVREFLRMASSYDPFRPFELTLVSVLFTLPTLLLLEPPFLAAVWALYIALTFLLSVFGRRLVTPRLSAMPVFVRVVLITVLTTAPFTMYLATSLVPSLPGVESVVAVTLYGSLFGAALAWFIAASQGLLTSHAAVLQRVAELDEQLRWAQVRAQSRLWLDQKRLALVLHNVVQGTLLSTAMKLRDGVGSDPTEIAQAVAAAQQTIEESLSVSFAEAAPRSVQQMSDELNGTWASLVEVKINCAEDARLLIEQDEVALAISGDLVTEFVLNSVKHGNAGSVQCELTPLSSNTLEVSLRNDSPAPSDRQAGLGLGDQFMSSVTLSRTAVDTPKGFGVTLTLPLSSQ